MLVDVNRKGEKMAVPQFSILQSLVRIKLFMFSMRVTSSSRAINRC